MNDSNDNDEVHPADAARALRERGISNVDELLAYGTPGQIIEVCHRWDRRPNAGPGLLAHMIRNGEFIEPPPATPSTSKGAIMRARFEQYADRLPVGSVAEPHCELQARRWPEDDPCPGDLIVTEAIYPSISVECDACQFEAAYPIRALHVLGRALRSVPHPDDQPF